MEFEFNPSKSESNKAKHGIDFVEAQALWQGRIEEIALPFPDEKRYAVLGKIGSKHYAAIITYRGDAIRIISVRRCREQEERLYNGE